MPMRSGCTPNSAARDRTMRTARRTSCSGAGCPYSDEPVLQHEGGHTERLQHAHRARGLVGHRQPGIAAAGTHDHRSADTGSVGWRVVSERGRLDVVDATVLEALGAAVRLRAGHTFGPERNHPRLRRGRALMGRRLAGSHDRRPGYRQCAKHHGRGHSGCHPRGSRNALGARASGVNRTRRIRPLKNDTRFCRTPIESGRPSTEETPPRRRPAARDRRNQSSSCHQR